MVSGGAIHDEDAGGGGGRAATLARTAATTETIARSGGPGSIVLDNLPAELAASRNDAAHTNNEDGSDQNDSVGNFSAGQYSVDTTRIGKYNTCHFFGGHP